MQPLLGYWLKVPAGDTLVYAGEPAPGMVSFREAAVSMDAVPPLSPTDRWISVCGKVVTPDGRSAPVGTVVDVVDGCGGLAGRTVVETPGLYGFLPVYLDDPSTKTDEGAAVGEWLDVLVDGAPTGVKVQWTEFGDIVSLDLVAPPPDAARPTNAACASVLHGAYPNPFNPSTTIRYDLAQASDVQLNVYAVTGQLVRQLVAGQQATGAHQVEWDGRDGAGTLVGNGAYLAELRAGEFRAVTRMVLMK
jgi:hypothetical protein